MSSVGVSLGHDTTITEAGAPAGPSTRYSRRTNAGKRLRTESNEEEECYDPGCLLPITSEEDVIRCQGPSCTNVVCCLALQILPHCIVINLWVVYSIISDALG